MNARRKLIFPLIIGLAFSGAFFFPSATRAQAIGSDDLTTANGWTCTATKSSCTNKNGATASCINGGGSSFGSSGTTITCIVKNPNGTGSSNSSTFTPSGVTSTSNQTTDAQGKVITASSQTTTTPIPGSKLLSCLPFAGIFGGEGSINCMLDSVGAVILTFANFLLGVAGVLFNLVMFYGVFQFANTIGNAPGVLVAWGILRDLANIALLFGFIFMGIATILDTGAVQGFTAKNALPKLLIFAILMNFSLFTCEAMIDVSNALASSMYTQSNTAACASTDTNCVVNYGLAGHIMQSTGLAGIWAKRGSFDLHAVQYLGLALFATIGAIVFFAASIMLAIRVILLTFLMIFSPMGFAGMAIPPLQKFAGDWWQRVIHQSFYAPIMLLLILISLKVADTFTGAGTSGTGAGVNNGLGTQVSASIADITTDPNASTISVVLVFMLIIGFMVASLIIANRYGAAGATAAVGIGKKIVLGSYGGTAGFLGRNSIGRASSWAQKSYKSNTALRRFATNTRLDSGIMKVTEAAKNGKYGGGTSFADIEKKGKERKHTLENLDRLDAVRNAKNIDEMTKAQKNVSENELPELVKQMKGNTAQLKLFAESLPADKLEKLINNKEYDDAHAKQELINLRYEDLGKIGGINATAAAAAAAYAANPADPALKAAHENAQKALGAEVKKLVKKDAGLIANSEYSSLLADPTFAAALSDDLFKGFKDADIPTAMKASLEDKRNERINDPAFIALNIPTMKLEDIGKIKDTALSDPRVVNAFASKVKDMNPEDINKLKSQIISSPEVLKAMSGRQLVAIDPSRIDETHIKGVVDHMEDVLLNDPVEGAVLQAHLLGNVKNKDKWKPYGL